MAGQPKKRHNVGAQQHQDAVPDWLNPLPLGITGLDIGNVPAGPHAFLRLSGQFGPLQLIFHWP